MDWIDAARVGIAVAVLGVAAYTDLKTRMAPDGLWYAGAAAAVVLMALDFSASFGGVAWVLAFVVGTIFVVAITGGEIISVFPGDQVPPPPEQWTERQKSVMRVDQMISVVLIAAALSALVLSSQWDLGPPVHPLAGPQAIAISSAVMVGAGLLFYLMGALHGGADAKAFMMLAVLVPQAPDIGVDPLVVGNPLARLYLPFVLVVLFNAALCLVLAAPLAFVVLSARAGRMSFPYCLAGYPKAVAHVNLERDFLMGTVVDGKWVPRAMLFRGGLSDDMQKEGLELLKKTGQESVFVSPKFPFLVYMLLGLLLAIFVGSPLLLF